MFEILIYDIIGGGFFDEGLTGEWMANQLKEAAGQPVVVRINSPGGDVFEAIAMYNQLIGHDAEVTVRIDSLCASAATVVAMAGKTVEMAENGLFMIHDPWALAIGAAADMRKTADLLDKAKGTIVTTYLTRASLSEDELAEAMTEETWMDAGEAVEAGFVDTVTGKSTQPQNTAAPWIRNAPATPAPGATSEMTVRVDATELREVLADFEKAVAGAVPATDKPESTPLRDERRARLPTL